MMYFGFTLLASSSVSHKIIFLPIVLNGKVKIAAHSLVHAEKGRVRAHNSALPISPPLFALFA